MKRLFIAIFTTIILAFIILFVFQIKIKPHNTEETSGEAILPKNTSWTLTQYGEKQMPQMMCFTIEGNEYGLVIIDGGYESSEDEVNNILNIASNHNNEVDAWILTHLDSDHAGVILNVIKNHPEVKINNIYTTNVPTFEQAVEKYPEETEWEQFQEFTALEMDNIHYLYENDKIDDVIGLKMNVLWAYSDWVYQNVRNLLNNGSLVFKLIGNEESMLFCGDTQSDKVEQKIVENHKKELDSDYLQIGHHGNNNFSKDFYKLVSPKVAFFAAPSELIENVNHISWYTAWKIKEWLEDDEVTIYSHETAPNVVTIK